MPRKPVRERYDAVLDFAPLRAVPEIAYLLLKQTYRIDAKGCVFDAPEPLAHDLRDETLEPRMPPGSDFWQQKQATDVVVRGSAFAPEGRPLRQMTAAVTVGSAIKRVSVFGDRTLAWRNDGTPIIPQPEPFTELPLTYANAYGGIDPRMEMAAPATPEEFLAFDLFDYPGIYPRNHHGKGYLIKPEPLPTVQLPNLENPNDLLTAERLYTRDPALWYRQPFPWCFDWTHALMFPRMAYLGLKPRYPAPSDKSLPEIANGMLPADFAERYSAELEDFEGFPLEYYQEASLGMHFKDLAPGTPFVIEGMHPEKPQLTFKLPAPPAIQLFMEGQSLNASVTLSNCVITPAESRVSLTYVAIVTEMPRVFIPEVHKEIPFTAVIDGDVPFAYEPPEPLLEKLERRS